MSFPNTDISIIIPQNKNSKNKIHYTKATVIDTQDLDEQLQDLMNNESYFIDISLEYS